MKTTGRLSRCGDPVLVILGLNSQELGQFQGVKVDEFLGGKQFVDDGFSVESRHWRFVIVFRQSPRQVECDASQKRTVIG